MSYLHVNKKYPVTIIKDGKIVKAVHFKDKGKVWRLPARTTEPYPLENALPQGSVYDEMEGMYKKNGKQVNDINLTERKGITYRLWRPDGLSDEQLKQKYGYLAGEWKRFNESRKKIGEFDLPDENDVGIVIKAPKANYLYHVNGWGNVGYGSQGQVHQLRQSYRKSGPEGHIFYAKRWDRNDVGHFILTDPITNETIRVDEKNLWERHNLDGNHYLTVNHLDFNVYESDGRLRNVFIGGGHHVVNQETGSDH